MKTLSIACAAALLLVAGTASAQSAKNAVKVGGIHLVSDDAGEDWHTVLSTTIHTSSQKDLIMSVSLETGLFTDTLVTSKKGQQQSSVAEAGIRVRVLVDGNEALPGAVIFDKRSQELIAKFGGIMQECTDWDGDGTISIDDCTWDDEEIRLILDTMAAHSFNFVLDDVGVGTHSVQVQVGLWTKGSSTSGASATKASVGVGSLVVEEVRLVQGATISL